MSNEKKIHEMLDTGLDDKDQSQLFSDLSTSEQLRDEFNLQLKIHTSTKEDMYSIAPPKNLTGAIFTSLGFSGVASIPWWSRLGQNAIGMGLSAIFASLITFWFVSNPEALTAENNNNLITKNKTTQVVTNHDIMSFKEDEVKNHIPENQQNNMNILPTVANKSSASQSNSNMDNFSSGDGFIFDKSLLTVGSELIRMVSDGLASITLYSDENDEANSEEIIKTKTNNFYSKQENLIDNLSDNPTNSSLENNSQSGELINISSGNRAYSGPSYFSSSNIDNGNWVITLRNVSVPQKLDYLASGSSSLINTIIGVQYRFYNWFSVGLEGGYEYFPQEYSLEVAGNSIQNWVQNPDLYWGTFTINLENPKWGLENVLFPYFQIGGGTSSMGWLAKSQLGLKLKPLSSVAFFASWDYTLYLYGVKGRSYSSIKNAYSLGAAFSF
jgi:hypothetical protein